VKGVVYQHEAAASADTARALWSRADEVIRMLEWTLARDDTAGLPYGNGPLRFIVFPGAKSVNMPSADVLFEPTQERVIIHEIEFF
jgi:hypothetical protein